MKTTKGIVSLKKKADGGDSDAQFELAKALFRRISDNPDNELNALYWFEKAAQSGNPTYQMHLGLIYCWDEGDIRDFEKGFNWIRMAAEQGNTSAQYFLAVEFATGANTNRNSKEAAYWYCKAAELGHPEAQYNLGIMYLEGDGVGKNIESGHYWLLKSAKNGEYLAIKLLVDTYKKGLLGFQVDEEKAAYWEAVLGDDD